MAVGTNGGGHKWRWAQMSVGTSVAGHKCRWAQISLGTNVGWAQRSGQHKCRQGANVREHIITNSAKSQASWIIPLCV